MEANICDINHLDSDVLLPPRKRLLACLKKQNGHGNSYSPSTSFGLVPNEYDSRLNNLLKSHLDNNDLSQEEIVEASRTAAEVALKAAAAARAAADEKAVIASKAVAAAKAALELVANINLTGVEDSTGRYSKKNYKMKKSVQVQVLYNHKKQRVDDSNSTDEELARKLHQAINSSPRISKYFPPSDVKTHKHKRLKGLDIPEKNIVSVNGSGISEVNSPSTSNGNGITREREMHIVKLDDTASNNSKMENGEGEKINSKEKSGEEDASSMLSRKRGRMKQKKLPLSICNFRDQASPKEDQNSFRSLDSGKATATSKPLFPVGPSGNGVMPVERTSLWKCQAFKAPACVKQNKVMQS